MEKNYICSAVKDATRRRGWTARDLATQSGVSIAYIYRILNGERIPSLSILFRVLVCLGLTMIIKEQEARIE